MNWDLPNTVLVVIWQTKFSAVGVARLTFKKPKAKYRVSVALIFDPAFMSAVRAEQAEAEQHVPYSERKKAVTP